LTVTRVIGPIVPLTRCVSRVALAALRPSWCFGRESVRGGRRRDRRQQHPVPGGLDREEGRDQGQPDSGGPHEETGILEPLLLPFLGHAPMEEARAALPGLAVRQGPLEPVARGFGELGSSARLEQPVEEMGHARPSMAQAGVPDTGRRPFPGRRQPRGLESLPFPGRLPRVACSREKHRRDSGVSIAPCQPGAAQVGARRDVVGKEAASRGPFAGEDPTYGAGEERAGRRRGEPRPHSLGQESDHSWNAVGNPDVILALRGHLSGLRRQQLGAGEPGEALTLALGELGQVGGNQGHALRPSGTRMPLQAERSEADEATDQVIVPAPGGLLEMLQDRGHDPLDRVRIVGVEEPALKMLGDPCDSREAAIETRTDVEIRQRVDGPFEQVNREVVVPLARQDAIEIGEEKRLAGVPPGQRKVGEIAGAGRGGHPAQEILGNLLQREMRAPAEITCEQRLPREHSANAETVVAVGADVRRVGGAARIARVRVRARDPARGVQGLPVIEVTQRLSRQRDLLECSLFHRSPL